MPLFVTSRVRALNSQRNLNKSQRVLDRSFKRLSSGFHVEGMTDDAAAMAISEELRARTESLRAAEFSAAARAAADGLDEVGNIISRMRSLAVQSANDDRSFVEQGILEAELETLVEQIDHLAKHDERSDPSPSDTAERPALSTARAASAFTAPAVALDGAGEPARHNPRADRLIAAVAKREVAQANRAAAGSTLDEIDSAAETSYLTRAQVLLESGISVLAQANQAPILGIALLPDPGG